MKTPIDYTIEPAKGQALLHFQGRRLPDKIELFETALIEEVRQNGQKKMQLDTQINADFRNLLIHGDCLSACAYLKSQNIKVDLVYIDPPFASGANYAKKINLRTGNGKAAFENSTSEIGEEIMYADIWQKEDYLNWLYERLLAIRDVMSDTGTIFVHLDWNISHYVKILLDEIFGDNSFLNHIVWCYQTRQFSKKYFNRKHHDIFWYCKSEDDYIFNWNAKEVLQDYSEETIKKYKLKDEIGYYRLCGRGIEGSPIKGAKDVDAKWEETNPELVVRDYLRDGFAPSDWWEIDIVNQVAKERTEYNTQKPEELLTKILSASSNEDMIVADFFSGSGVTAKVASDLGRKFITCDIGINAIQTTRDRLVKAKAEFDVLKINDGVRLFRNPAQTVAKLFSLLDGYKDRAELQLGEFWDGGMINKRGTFTPVKFIGIDKKLTKELVDVIIEEVIGLEDTNQEDIKTESGIEPKIPTVKIIYAYKKPELNQEYVNKAIRQSKKTNIKAELVSLDELLAQKADVLYTPDNAVVEMKQYGTIWKVEIKKFFSSYLKNKIDDFNNKKVKTVQKTIDEENGNEDNSNGEEKTGGKKKIEISEIGLELIESVQFDTILRNDGVWSSNLDLEDKAGVKDKIKAVYKLTTNKFRMKIRNIAGDEIIIDSLDLKK